MPESGLVRGGPRAVISRLLMKNLKLKLKRQTFTIIVRSVATYKPGKPGLTSFSETLALFFIQFLSFRKMKVQDRQNGPSGLRELNWLATRLIVCARFGKNDGIMKRSVSQVIII